ncbi:MAG: DNA mismatch repair protein MutS, partial [Acidobacteriota bacterium]
MTSPKSEYQQRLTARQSALTATESISHRYWLWRRVSFIVIPILIVLSIEDYVTPLLIAVPVLAYLILMIRHQKVMRAIDHYRRAVTYYENCLARLDDEWIGRGVTGENLAVAGHPYAADLDIFGQGSLFELLCRARTRAGEGRLASWLLAPASPATIRIRQQAIAELRERLD